VFVVLQDNLPEHPAHTASSTSGHGELDTAQVNASCGCSAPSVAN
jgi:hypothetical protein